MKRAISCLVVLALSLGDLLAQDLNEMQQKTLAALNSAAELNDRKEMENVVRKNLPIFKEIFNQYDWKLGASDDVDTWKTARMLGDLLDADGNTNEHKIRLGVIEKLNLDQRQERMATWNSFLEARTKLQTAAKAKDKDALNAGLDELNTLASKFQELGDGLFASYALWEIAAVLREDNQKVESGKVMKQIIDLLKASGFTKFKFLSDVENDYALITGAGGSAGGDGGGPASGGSSTSWAADEAGQRWSDPVPLKLVVDEKLPWSKITTPGFTNSEDTMQWFGWQLRGNGPETFNENFKPLGREMKVRRDGVKIQIDEDGDGKYRDVKAQFKPSVVEMEKEFVDPWTKQTVKQKYAFLLGCGGEQETFFGFQINAAPGKDYYGMRYAPGCYLRGTALGLDLKIIDDNVSGRFGDSFNTSFGAYAKKPAMLLADAMTIGNSNIAQPFSEFIEVGGEFYRLKMSTDDEAYSVKTRKLAIETGTLLLDFKNKLKPEALIVAATGEFKGAYFNIASGKPVRVPVDRYKVAYGIMRTGRKESMQSCVIVAGDDMTSFEVKKDAETKIELGSPYHFVFEAEETGNGDVKVPGNSVAVMGRAGELYIRFWDDPPIPDSVQIYRDGKPVGKGMAMKRASFNDYQQGGLEVLFQPLDLTLPGNGSVKGTLGVAMKLKKHKMLDGVIETKHDAKH